jgi:hypothetical protein
MKLNIKNLLSILFLMSFMACTKTKGFNGLSDNRPEIPVTVSNATDYRVGPSVRASLSGGGKIDIQFSIPATSGRTIKEITQIAVSSSFAAVQNATPPKAGFTTWGYNNSIPASPGKGTNVPIAGNSFSTTLAAYSLYYKTLINTSLIINHNTELPAPFYFVITLDDGTQLLPQPVKVLVID